MTWTPTNGRKPRTGEKALWIKFRNGQISKQPYVAAQLRWNDTGDGWDIVEVSEA